MFDDDNSIVYQVEFRNGRYSNETFLIPNEFENDIYTFELNSRGDVDISAFPDNGDVELNFYRDRNNNRTLDRNDQLIDTSDNGGDESISERVSSGTYFAHVGLDRIDRGERELDYRIDINTNNNNNSNSDPLFDDNVTDYRVEFNRGSYSNESFLIPDEFEHDIYTFELNSSGNIDISASPDNGEVDLELYEDSNNNNKLDQDDDLIDSSSGDDESISERVSSGTYFAHVGLDRLDRGERELDYRIDINTNNNNNSNSDPLFDDNVTDYRVEFNRGSYSNESFLIPDEFEHDIYTFELNSSGNIDISASPDDGEVDLELYEDSNNNNRLDEDDDLIDSSSGDDESISERVSSGTYFAHVGLDRLDRGENELDYRIEIETDDDSGSDSLFNDNVNEYEVDFDNNRYRNDSSLIFDEVEHDIYKIELSSRKQLQISAFPDNGEVKLELYEDDNNNGRLDVEDDLIETADSSDDKEFLTDTVSRGTYFAHVELLDIDRNDDELDYRIEIKTNSSSRSFSLLTEETGNLGLFQDNYNNEIFLTNLTDF